jgi:hypothetical protein
MGHVWTTFSLRFSAEKNWRFALKNKVMIRFLYNVAVFRVKTPIFGENILKR